MDWRRMRVDGMDLRLKSEDSFAQKSGLSGTWGVFRGFIYA
jgi:hypothetical protein